MMAAVSATCRHAFKVGSGNGAGRMLRMSFRAERGWLKDAEQDINEETPGTTLIGHCSAKRKNKY
tara:strand:- start:60 stop:254 length:195 start_codon:yes stop_codon:yes gene_type:complete